MEIREQPEESPVQVELTQAWAAAKSVQSKVNKMVTFPEHGGFERAVIKLAKACEGVAAPIRKETDLIDLKYIVTIGEEHNAGKAKYPARNDANQYTPNYPEAFAQLKKLATKETPLEVEELSATGSTQAQEGLTLGNSGASTWLNENLEGTLAPKSQE